MLKSRKENKPFIYYKENYNDIPLCDWVLGKGNGKKYVHYVFLQAQAV